MAERAWPARRAAGRTLERTWPAPSTECRSISSSGLSGAPAAADARARIPPSARRPALRLHPSDSGADSTDRRRRAAAALPCGRKRRAQGRHFPQGGAVRRGESSGAAAWARGGGSEEAPARGARRPPHVAGCRAAEALAACHRTLDGEHRIDAAVDAAVDGLELGKAQLFE